MEISGETQLIELKNSFKEVFPNLKIEFYSKAHRSGEGTSKKHLLNDQLFVKDISGSPQIGFISLNQEMTVGEFENVLRDQFGLNVQVFRKTYKGWLQTWASDVWTLGEQNHRAKSFL